MRESAQDLMLIDSTQPQNLRIATLNKDGRLEDLFLGLDDHVSIKNNIYLGTVVRTEHSLQCAFVDFGGDRNGFLPFSEIHLDYYNIPTLDKKELLEKAKASEGKFENLGRSRRGDEFGSIGSEICKKYNIQEVIKRGQNVLVQVYKDARGSKGVSLTTFISLASRYCVLTPNGPNSSIAISRKISNPEERRRIFSIAKEFPAGDNVGMVMRTFAAGIPAEDLKKDFTYVANLWNAIRSKTLESKVGSLIYSDVDPIRQSIRDDYVNSIRKVIVEGGGYEIAASTFKDFMPSMVNRVVRYKGSKSLFLKYGVEEQIDELLNERVDLPSGGYLVFNQTEALVAIDINSGRATNEENVEAMALQINLEASKEIARQLRLRGLGGLIVIDFIDMSSMKNRREIENVFSMALKQDRAKTQCTRISVFGILECSRQRIGSSLIEISTLPCGACCGMGRIRSGDFVSSAILRSLESSMRNATLKYVQIHCSPQLIQSLKVRSGASLIMAMGKKHNFKIDFVEDSMLSSDAFTIKEKITIGRDISYKILEENKGCASQIVAKELKYKARSPFPMFSKFKGKFSSKPVFSSNFKRRSKFVRRDGRGQGGKKGIKGFLSKLFS